MIFSLSFSVFPALVAYFYLCFNVQLQDAVEYAECEAVVKDYPPFQEAMKKRGIEDMDLVMVDPW